VPSQQEIFPLKWRVGLAAVAVVWAAISLLTNAGWIYLLPPIFVVIMVRRDVVKLFRGTRRPSPPPPLASTPLFQTYASIVTPIDRALDRYRVAAARPPCSAAQLAAMSEAGSALVSEIERAAPRLLAMDMPERMRDLVRAVVEAYRGYAVGVKEYGTKMSLVRRVWVGRRLHRRAMAVGHSTNAVADYLGSIRSPG